MTRRRARRLFDKFRKGIIDCDVCGSPLVGEKCRRLRRLRKVSCVGVFIRLAAHNHVRPCPALDVKPPVALFGKLC